MHSYKELRYNNELKTYLEGKVDNSDLKHVRDIIYIKNKKGLNLAIFATEDQRMIKNYKGALELKKHGILILTPEEIREFFKIYLSNKDLKESQTLMGSKYVEI